MPTIEKLVWIDLETTGTDERKDFIIEVGAILTDLQLNTLSTFESLIQLTNAGWGRLASNEFIKNMHTENGLLEELRIGNENHPTAWEVNDGIVKWLKANECEPHKVMLAGSGVSHFDRRFIKQHLPNLDNFLAYPSLDIGVIRRFAELIVELTVPPFNDGKTHRGLEDIRCHLEEAKWFAAYLDRDTITDG